ncbi:MAG: hypothetical protein AAFY50_24785 [Cyanobacteria bacterium J06648_1]
MGKPLDLLSGGFFFNKVIRDAEATSASLTFNCIISLSTADMAILDPNRTYI